MKEELKENKNLTYLKTGSSNKLSSAKSMYYSSKIYNEVSENNFLLREGIRKLAEIVQKTYGPRGGTVILHDEFGKPYATKDGVSVAKRIEFKDPQMNAGASLIKQSAENTQKNAGDGTTTSIILSKGLIEEGFRNGLTSKEDLLILEELKDYIINELTKRSRKLEKQDLLKVAKIACNNDTFMAEVVKEAFANTSSVKVEKSNSFYDWIDPVRGMSLRTTYYDNAFINDRKSKKVSYEDVKVILVDGKLQKIEAIEKLLIRSNPIVVIADDFSDYVISLMKHNYNKGNIEIVPVKSPGIGVHRKNLMSDISVYTEAEILSPNTRNADMSKCGHLKGISVESNRCILFKDKTCDSIQRRISELKKYLEKDIEDREKELTKQRIEGLKASSKIIKVGGDSELEVKERLDRYKDAVRAVECAKEEGTVRGGGKELYEITKDKKNPFSSCFGIPYNILEPKDEDSLLDPVKVLKQAVKNSVSIAKTILSTKAIVLNRDQWEN